MLLLLNYVDEVGGVSARRQTDYQALVVSCTTVVVQPVCGLSSCWMPSTYPL